MQKKRPIVIVGNGGAGLAAAKALRQTPDRRVNPRPITDAVVYGDHLFAGKN
ncbi:MAG: hypothetical protein ACYCV0_20335 [Desulfitobacteriaceae bacterium]